MKPGVTPLGWAWRNAAITVAYLVLGLAAGQLSGGPVSGMLVLSPGAGIALVAALTGGWRLMPGVVAGSVALGAMHYGLATVSPSLTSAPGILFIAVAVVLQAMLAAALARRGAHLAVDDDQPWSEFHALMIGALCCVISAATRSLLIVNGDPAAPDALLVFIVAWAGSASGVLIVAPLALALAFSGKALWRKRLVNTLLPTLLTLAGVLAVSLLVDAHEKRRLQADFEGQVYEVDAELQQRFVVYRRVVLSISRFWQSSDNVEREEFRRFVTPVLEEFPALQALEWVPVVPRDQRAAYEQRGRADGIAGFAIRERDPADAKRLVPAGERDQYLPVLYVEPMAGNELVFGFDIGSAPDRAGFLKAAQQRRAPTGSPPLTLLQDQRENNGLLIIMPIRSAPVAGGDRITLLGYAVSVFHIDAMLVDVGRAALRAGLSLAITDVTDGGSRPVYRMPDYAPESAALRLSRDFDFNGRQWRIDYASTARYTAGAVSILPWLTLVGGCLLVGLLQALLLGLSGHASRTQREVELRTRELRGLADLGEALQAAGSSAEAHEVMATHIPALFESGRGGMLVVPPGSTVMQELVQWGGADAGGKRIEIPLVDGEERLGLIWLEQAPSAARADGRDQNIRDVAQCVVLALGNLRMRDALREQSIRDALTGLYNRRHMVDVFRQELASARRYNRPFCVALMDIDHFKRVNDTYGHDAGDRVLQALAQFLRSNLRSNDFCFRLGGEEFTLLLPDTVLADGLVCVDKLRAGFNTLEFNFEGHPTYRPGFSAGVIEAPRSGESLELLLHLADEALYRAKSGGRNQVLPAGEGAGSPGG